MINNTPSPSPLPGPLRKIENRVPKLIKAYCDDYPKKKGIHTALVAFGFLSIYFLANNTIESYKELLGSLIPALPM